MKNEGPYGLTDKFISGFERGAVKEATKKGWGVEFLAKRHLQVAGVPAYETMRKLTLEDQSIIALQRLLLTRDFAYILTATSNEGDIRQDKEAMQIMGTFHFLRKPDVLTQEEAELAEKPFSERFPYLVGKFLVPLLIIIAILYALRRGFSKASS